MEQKRKKGWDSTSWASLTPFGMGETKPHHFKEMIRVAWENRDQLGYAWRILNQGCCDGCALGTTGMKDWTLPGTHLCMVRLNLLRMNTMPALDGEMLTDLNQLKELNSRDMREWGRLPYPMLRRKGDAGFHRISWDKALNLAADQIRKTIPERLAFYLTSRGIGNEVYFAANKAARFLGTNHIDNAARICHAPSTVALTRSTGVGATTLSYTDWIGTDLLILVGSNLANNQPVATKYIYHAKKAGTKVVVVNPYEEEGLKRYWVPSVTESALFGTKLTDDFYSVSIGGDAAFFNGVLKHLIETKRVDRPFIDGHTRNFDEVERHVTHLSWEELERSAGTTRKEMIRFANQYADADTSITVWSMGVTQHSHGTDNVQSLVNLALAMGRIGRPHTGLNPIRGHSGVQGGAEMGAVPNAYGMGLPVESESADHLKQLWGFTPPTQPGLKAGAMIQAAYEGNLDTMMVIGGNFLETLPDPLIVREALARIPHRIHQDIVLSPQMLVEPEAEDGWVLILPAATRYETPGGITETSTERRVIFSPEIPGPRIEEARPEWWIPVEIAKRVYPERASLIHYEDPAAIRADIARTIPAYDGIQHLKKQGDQFQWGGVRLCEDGNFATDDGRARFYRASLPHTDIPEGMFRVGTRRGKQFNSMLWGEHDPLTDSVREDVFISPADADSLRLADGDPVLLRSSFGEMKGRIKRVPIQPRNLQVHWPEGNALIPFGRFDRLSGEPDYHTIAELIPLKASSGMEAAAGRA
ncbi:FdhF/YdeP family oxidoreductase [Desmospora profundinema]|uniref:Molybdopterin-dependent oxidoreductase alpha subunit n=1 Tax=Desmospora profundinema TaxID=1571184 RepID=A0ABU1IRZ9_9BACL|nr:FdhF/YdeP family oxidoreductase [Desmospora profundinema]MDR6227563.1 molybdopterin-dependent oxidoreductase alpha subunit [Desmospora profundinema]